MKITSNSKIKTVRPYSYGFSLIELMISLVIGSIILLSLIMLFSSNSGNQNELEKTIRKLENIRYSMDTISEDIMHAGFYSHLNPNSFTPNYSMLNPCATTISPTSDQGWDLASTPITIPLPIQGIAKDDDLTAPCLTNRLAGTAAIIVRRAETGAGTPIGVGTPTGSDATKNSNLYIQISGCNTEITAGNSFLVSPGPASQFTRKMANCTTVSNPVRRLLQRIYYIASCNDCTANDGIPTLKRIEMINGTLQISSIAEGIENMQFEYGVDIPPTLDSQSDGQPDIFEGNSNIFDKDKPSEKYIFDDTKWSTIEKKWANVVGVRLHLLARSTQTTAGFSDSRTYQVGPGVSITTPADGFKRTLLTTTVRLNNVAGRLE